MLTGLNKSCTNNIMGCKYAGPAEAPGGKWGRFAAAAEVLAAAPHCELLAEVFALQSELLQQARMHTIVILQLPGVCRFLWVKYWFCSKLLQQTKD